MTNGSPPARRRPSPGTPSGGTGSRPATRRTSPGGAAAPRPAPASIGSRLVCTAGPKAGEDFPLEEGEYVIGRSNDNPICIPDTSVSRKHVMVRKVGAGWAVSDLGSGNGTLVNGDPISDETPLAHGDIVTLGDTELRFEDVGNSTMMVATGSRPRVTGSRGAVPARPPPRTEGGRVRTSRSAAVAAPSPEAQRKKKRMMLAGGLVVAVLFAGLGVVRMQQQQQQQQQALIVQKQQAEVEERRVLFSEAKRLVREHNWVAAKVEMDKLHALAPDYPGLSDYLAHAEREIPIQQALEEAQAALAKNELGRASALLAKCGDSQFLYEQVGAAKRALAELADKRTIAASAALAGQQLEEARDITGDVLKAFPEHRDAKLINEQALAAITERDRPKPVVVGPPPKPWEAGVDRFRDGDTSGAVALLNACSGRNTTCKRRLAQINEFSTLYKRLEVLDARGLTKLLALDKQITDGRTSKMARNAGTRAATIFYKSATAAKASGQWARAMEYSRRALQAEPGHAGATNIISEMKTRAKDLYLSAYSLKDENPEDALPKFKDVVAMTPPDDEYHEKAKSWIEKLSR